MASKFETTECSRCGGCGRYSYCAMYGDTCFKCSGSGRMLTKRGAAARTVFLASLERTYGEVEVGWRVFDSGRGWRTVTAVDVATPAEIADRSFGAHGVKGTGGSTGIPQEWIANTHRIHTKSVTFVGMAHYTITAYGSREEYDALLNAALETQRKG